MFNGIISIDYAGYTSLGTSLINDLLFHNTLISVEWPDMMGEMFNCLSNYILGCKLDSLTELENYSFLVALINQISVYTILWHEVWFLTPLSYCMDIWVGISFNFDSSVIYIFCIFFWLLLLYRVLSSLGVLVGGIGIVWNEFLILFTYIWVRLGSDKLESVEEAVAIMILWPWCILLIFTHIFMLDNHSFLFGFAEWGLPILYGLILLFEHFWVFGIYILVYLIGIRGRRSFMITFIEDIVAISIMFARVILQSIRGIIVGMFHFICREALLNMTRWWSHEIWFSHSDGTSLYDVATRSDFMFVISDFFLAVASLVVVMAIMFLQLIFLIVSVWLFCKCWFMSWGNTSAINISFRFVRIKDRLARGF